MPTVTRMAWKRRFLFFVLAESALAELFNRAVRKLKSAVCCSTSTQYQAMTRLDPDVLLRMASIACASMCWKGSPEDADGIQALAEEFRQYYLAGPDGKIPRADRREPGKPIRR